jgi:Secretion system C-terminal sorting domain
MWPLLFFLDMKKIIIVLTLLFGCIQSVLCQNDWSIVYDHDLTYEDYTALEILNDTIYTAHLQWNRDTNLFGVVLMKYDSNGFLLDTLECFNPDRILTRYNFYSGFEIHNRTLYYYGTSTGYVTYLIKATTDFTQDTIIYYPPNPGVNFTGATGLLATESGLYLLAQQKKPGELNDILVIHTDLEGKELWRKVYETSVTNELALSIIKKKDNEVVIGGQRFQPQQLSKEFLFAIDSLGNVLWEKLSFENENRATIIGLHIVNDKYVFSGSKIFNNPNGASYAIPYISSRDTTTFDLQWSTDLILQNNNFDNRIWNTCLTPDSTAIVGVGRLDDGGPAFHFKVNTETGAVIYQRELIGCTEEYAAIDTDLFDVACLSSGSTVACGYTVLNTPIAPAYTGWIIKTNAYGIDLLDECSTVPIIEHPVYTGVEMKIYPNPATTHITLELPESREKYTIRVVNLNGLILYQAENQAVNPLIDINALQNGFYFVQIVNKVGNILNAQRFVKMD